MFCLSSVFKLPAPFLPKGMLNLMSKLKGGRRLLSQLHRICTSPQRDPYESTWVVLGDGIGPSRVVTSDPLLITWAANPIGPPCARPLTSWRFPKSLQPFVDCSRWGKPLFQCAIFNVFRVINNYEKGLITSPGKSRLPFFSNLSQIWSGSRYSCRPNVQCSVQGNHIVP